MRPTVSDRLRGRRSRLVGRDEELQRARQLIAGDGGQVALYVHGPGGVGKTSYLREVEHLAEDLGRPTRWVDADDLEPTPEALLAALGARHADDLPETIPERAVILLDRFEALATVERWFWREPVLALPDDVLLVVGGRLPPAQLDDRLTGLVTVLPLRNLAASSAARCASGASPTGWTSRRWSRTPTDIRSRW